MTWGKAILQWSSDYKQALQRMIDLNHRYALDGRDPASYGGILWCLGQFDRPFTPEQPVFGTVRTRSLEEHQRRVNLDAYQRHVDRAVYRNATQVAIIGAGLGGLICARTLSDHGIKVQVFDKSRRPGGRAATRVQDTIQFDHGAQYFTIRDPRMKRLAESWLQDGHIARWEGRIVEIKQDGTYHPVRRSTATSLSPT